MFSMKNFVGRFFSALQSAAYGACLGVLVASAVIVAEAVRDTGDAARAYLQAQTSLAYEQTYRLRVAGRINPVLEDPITAAQIRKPSQPSRKISTRLPDPD